MSDLQSYFVAGPENLLSHHISKTEKPEKALIRIVSELAENGLDVFQLRAKSMKDIQIIELIKDLRSATSNTKMKIFYYFYINLKEYKKKAYLIVCHIWSAF